MVKVEYSTWTFAYNPAGQIVSETSANALYDWPAPGADFNDSYSVNGLNQYTDAGGEAFGGAGAAAMRDVASAGFPGPVLPSRGAVLSGAARGGLAGLIGAGSGAIATSALENYAARC